MIYHCRYLQQISQWIRCSQTFFEYCVAPAAAEDTKSEAEFPGHSTFCHGLLDLVNKKLKHDLPLVIDDDVHLSHLIDEVLFFCKEVRQLLESWRRPVSFKKMKMMNV